MNFLKKVFSNNGVARGLLYAGIQIFTALATAFTGWSETPPRNWYAVGAVILGALASAGTTLRAYIDQHLSSVKNANSKQPPV